MIKEIDIQALEQYYIINDNGTVYSKIKNRYLSVHLNSSGYEMYFLSKPFNKWFSSHSLVACKFMGKRLNRDINHIDNDKQNNNVSNLEYCTHSENIKKSYASGRVAHWKGKKKGATKDSTKALMAAKKCKQCIIKGITYNSVKEASIKLGVSTKTISRIINK